MSPTMSETRVSIAFIMVAETSGGKCDILSKIVGSGESFAAMRADIWSLLGVGADMPKRRDVSVDETCTEQWKSPKIAN